MPAGVAAQAVERRLRGQSPLLGKDAFGMFDGDPAVECGLELFGDDLAVADNSATLYPTSRSSTSMTS